MKDKKEKTIIIPLKEYKDLVKDSDFLMCLEGAGVDNWDGYSEAMRLLKEMEDIIDIEDEG